MNKLEFKYLLMIIVVFIAACIETDIYLPAFPDMMTYFSATEGSIQSLLSWNFIGICLSGPLYGPISDSLGRKRPLIWALGTFFLGSVVTVLAQDLNQMLLGRVLQGLGSGGCFTLGTAILFDAFQKERAISALNNLNTIIPLIMAGAPMLGGILNQSFGFRSNFLVIALFVLLSLIVCMLFLKETLPENRRTPFDLKMIVKDFKEAFSHLAFWQLTLVLSLLFGAYIAFLSGTSVLFVVEFGMSKKIFPLVQGAILGGWVLGSLFLNRALVKWGILKVKKTGIALIVIGSLFLFLLTLVAPRDPYLATSAVALYAVGANWVIGLYFPEGMELLPRIKGVTSSLLTSVRLLIGACIVGLTGSLYNATIYPLVFVILGAVLMILPTLFFYERAKALKIERT